MVFVILKYILRVLLFIFIIYNEEIKYKKMIFNKKLLKTHKPSINSSEYKSTILYTGRIGLKVLDKGWIELNQLNAIKHFFKRFLKKKKGTVWYRLFPERYVTKKSLGNARMGKGKGAIDRIMLYVKKGQIIFEIKIKNFKNENFIFNLLKQCKYKLPLNVKIIFSKQ